jgi:hypothetical protein
MGAKIEPFLELLETAAADGYDDELAGAIVRVANDQALTSLTGISNALDLASVDDSLITEPVGGPRWNPASI